MSVHNDIVSGFFNLVPDSYFESWLDGGQDLNCIFNDFEFRLSKSTHQSSPLSTALLDRIAGACLDSIKSDTLLLLSSGKDSVGLLLGYAEAGIHVDCLSVVSDKEEEDWIAKTARHLGHKVSFVRSNDILRFLESTELDLHPDLGVCYDQAIIVMDAALAIFSAHKGINIIDGMGNDIYFGHIPSRNQLRSANFGSIFPIFRSLPGLSFYLRSPYKAHGLATATSFIFKSAKSSCHEILNELPYASNEEDIVDYRAFVRGGLIDNFVYAEKTRILARKYQCIVNFPWTNGDLMRYVFNLPNNCKFNFSSLTNKILLRKLLSEKLDYNRPKRGIDLLGAIDISNLLALKCIRNIPMEIVNKVLAARLMPINDKKRALFECALYFNYLERIGEHRNHGLN